MNAACRSEAEKLTAQRVRSPATADRRSLASNSRMKLATNVTSRSYCQKLGSIARWCSVDRFQASGRLGTQSWSCEQAYLPIMRWVREHIRRGSWLALVALVINLGLSFGHVHGIDASRLGQLSASPMTSVASPDDSGTQGHHDKDQADLLCPICMAAGAMGHALAAPPPTLPLALLESPIDLAIEPVLAVPQSPRAAFQSRGPPIS